jgi:hypothetical protein
MKKPALVALVLVALAALPAAASTVPSSFFTLTGVMASLDCTAFPGEPSPMRCVMTVKPSLDDTSRGVQVRCLDEAVVKGCGSLLVGDPVLIVGSDQRGVKIVEHVAYLLDAVN